MFIKVSSFALVTLVLARQAEGTLAVEAADATTTSNFSAADKFYRGLQRRQPHLGLWKETVPYGVFFGKIFYVDFVGLQNGSCSEVFDKVDCIGNSARITRRGQMLADVCGFGGTDRCPVSKTKSFACHGPAKCRALGYPKGSRCKEWVPIHDRNVTAEES